MYRLPRVSSGTAVAVCEPQPWRGMSWVEKRRPRTNFGFSGSEMSKMWMPSKPWPTSWPPQDCVAAPFADTGESHERTRMFL